MSDQYEPHPVTDAALALWDEEARAAVGKIRLGSFNWIGAVRSLTAEVRRLRAAAASQEAP